MWRVEQRLGEVAMSDQDQREFGFSGPPNHRLRRGIFLLPSAFTVANLLCGFYAILAVFKGGVADLDYASRAIGLAIVFDAFDGFRCTATKRTPNSANSSIRSRTWLVLELRPAIFAFAWGVRGFGGRRS